MSASARRSLMNACRLTPIRCASRSIAWSRVEREIHVHPLDLAPWPARLRQIQIRRHVTRRISDRQVGQAVELLGGDHGGLAPPFRRVNVLRLFVVARAADRDEADRFVMAICHRGSPDGLRDLATMRKRGSSVGRAGSSMRSVRPQRLRLNEVNSVLGLVRGGLRGSNSNRTRYMQYIIDIPLSPQLTCPSVNRRRTEIAPVEQE